jgi:hypothetical protein
MGVIIQPVYKPLPKARLCVKCRGYVPSAHFVSALDSACDRHEHSDAGLRYCTVCDDFVDMHKFPGFGVGNLCREHLCVLTRETGTNKARMKDPEHKRRVLQWRRCHTDCKTFKQGSVSMSLREIETEIMKINSTATDSHAVVPFDPNVVISVRNVVVVTMDQRKTLVKLFRKSQLDTYNSIVAEIRGSYV